MYVCTICFAETKECKEMVMHMAKKHHLIALKRMGLHQQVIMRISPSNNARKQSMLP